MIAEACAYLIGLAEDRRQRVHESIAKVLARAGNTADAIRFALSLPVSSKNFKHRDYLLEQLVGTVAATGDLTAARRIIRHITSPLTRLWALEDLAIVLAQRGRPKQAAAVIRSMRGSKFAGGQRQSAWTGIAQWHAYRGDAASAFAAVRALRNSEERATTLTSMAVCAAAEGEPPMPIPPEGILIERRSRRAEPRIYLAAAETAARRLRHRSAVWRHIGRAAAKIGAMDMARRALNEIAGTYWAGWAAAIHKEIALAEARGGRFAQAKQTIRRIRRHKIRAAALVGIAAAEAEAGDGAAASATAGAIRLAEYRAAALLAIGTAAKAGGRREEAKRRFREVSSILKSQLTKKAKLESWVDRLYEETTREQAAIGDFCGAARTVLAKEKERIYFYTIFEATALAFAKAGNYEAALCFAKRTHSLNSYAPLLARIELMRRKREPRVPRDSNAKNRRPVKPGS